MQIGEKIRKVREIKGWSQENLAAELEMTTSGYGKIERNEVSVNVERLTKIAEVLGVGIETIIGFDDKIAFNNYNNQVEQQIGYFQFPAEMKKLYEDKIRLLEEKIEYLESKIKV